MTTEVGTGSLRSPTENPEKHRSLPSLQILRGVAALLVVTFHVTEQFAQKFDHSFLGGLFLRGWCGVDLFFVLSGFIIAHIHGADVGHAGRLPGYLAKRFVRIYPLYWCVLTLAMLVAFAVPQFATDRERSLEVLLRSWFLLPSQGLPLLGVAWTLCHEVYFYGVFALMIMIRRRWAQWFFISWLAASAGYGFADGDFSWPPEVGSFPSGIAFAGSFLLNPLNLEFGTGVVLAVWLNRGANLIPNLLRYSLLTLGVGILVVGALFIQIDIPLLPPFIARVLMYAIAGACLVTCGVAGDHSRVNPTPGHSARWLALPSVLLRAVGDASYSLYLIHYPLIVFACAASTRWLQPSPLGLPWVGLGLISVVTLVGLVTHHFFERPLLRWGRRFIKSSHR